MSATKSPQAEASSEQKDSSQQVVLAGMGRALVQHRVMRPDQAMAIQKAADMASVSFIDELLSSKGMTPKALATFAAETFGHPILDLASLDLSNLPADLLDAKLAQQARVIPIGKRGSKISVALSDPTDFQTLDQIKFSAQAGVDPVVVEHDKLQKLVEAMARSQQDIDDAPVVKFLQKVLVDGIQGGASDIHFEPYEKFYRIRFRIDGELREIAQPPLAIKEKLATRIKVISRLDISEKRIPQDGRMKLVLSGNRAIDFRVSTLPTLFGEKIVMRILDPNSAKLGIDALGYDPIQKELLLEAVQRPYGMVLVTGPTGSGKTVSLYTCLNILNEPGVNIATAEDPAEINLPGINQVNVNDKAGLTFEAALKSFLRQDPDVIMVGEIRDLGTADISIKAAQTGHMVMSTLHTNDAPTTLTRMMNMGVAPFNIASSVIMITAQRLGRRLCSCKEVHEMDDDALLEVGFRDEDLDGTWQAYKPKGCDRCGGSGYKGRVGIYQVMPITEAIQKIILSGGNALEIAEQAEKDGVNDLRRSGLIKVMQGHTSIEAVMAVTNE